MLAPIVVCHGFAVLMQYLSGTQKRRDKLRILDKTTLYLEGLRTDYHPRYADPNTVLPAIPACWDPCSAVFCAFVSGIVAVLSGVILKMLSNNQVDLGLATLLWLTRPRATLLTIILSQRHNRKFDDKFDDHSLVETGLDVFYQDCLQSLFALPFALMVASKVGLSSEKAVECIGRITPNTVDRYALRLYWGGALGIILGGVLSFVWLVFTAMKIFKQQRLALISGRKVLMNAALSAGTFATSWIFWVGKFYTSRFSLIPNSF